MPDATLSIPALSPLHSVLQQAETSCIKCGFCLPACPTYRLTGNEAASPRGRIDLMQAVVQGELDATEIAEQLDFCLGCRACETACPAGVEFGRLLEAGRAVAYPGKVRSRLGAWVQRTALHWLLPAPARLHALASILRFYQVSGISRLLRASGVLARLAPALATMEAFLPPVPTRAARRRLPAEVAPVGTERGCVLLLTGCVVPVLLPQVHRATVQVLSRNGYRVRIPPTQRCCGALQAHAGELELARSLARHNIAVFEAIKADYLVVNAAGCGAMMKAYGHLLSDDPAFAARATALSARVRDISELLAATPLRGPLGPLPLRVAYDDPCHLVHGQRIREQPRTLLRQVPGLELVEVPESDWCCGSAGIYNLLHPAMAQQLLSRKMQHLAAVAPQVIATGNPGCIFQLRQGVVQHRVDAEVLHPVEVLARAYDAAS